MKKSMLRGLVLSAIAAGTFAFSAQSTEAAVQINPINNISSDFIKGADVSMLPEMEKLGAKFYDTDGTQMDELQIMKKLDPFAHLEQSQGRSWWWWQHR